VLCLPQIMWEAAQLPGGKQEWADIALQHARTVTKELLRWGPLLLACLYNVHVKLISLPGLLPPNGAVGCPGSQPNGWQAHA